MNLVIKSGKGVCKDCSIDGPVTAVPSLHLPELMMGNHPTALVSSKIFASVS